MFIQSLVDLKESNTEKTQTMILDWRNIETVLLDMDGTLLDRHFDDHFWLEHVPKRWSSKYKVPVKLAREQLYALFRSQERTLNWTDLDYWSKRLGLDIPLLKLEVDHLIAVHPGVIEFLSFCRGHDKKIWLVTNAHSKTLNIKMKKTRIGHWFDGTVSAHQVGMPKEDPRFWAELQRFISYDPASTLLGEDSEENLGTARGYGIRYLFYISHYSSRCMPAISESFATIDYFTRLIPADGSSTVKVN